MPEKHVMVLALKSFHIVHRPRPVGFESHLVYMII